MESVTPAELAARAPIPYREFVAMIASIIALGALGIDTMLPALPAIGRSLDVASPNARQWVITAFTLGFGVGQLFHGPLSDRFGRRPVLLVALAGYLVANVLCAVAASFPLLLAARGAGGVLVASSRIITVALVRDRFSGRGMARVMSTAFIVFMIVPVLAPTLGWAILLVADWRATFWVIAALTVLVGGWFAWRMPETLPADARSSLSPRRIAAGVAAVLGDRVSRGYTLASAALLGALYGYLFSIEQVVSDSFNRPQLLTGVFAVAAGMMAVANLINARLVLRLGTRLISHSALAGLIVLAAAHLLLVGLERDTLVSFTLLQGLAMACYGLATANFSAMAMQNMGAIAGTASSVQGFTSVTLGTLFGAAVGQAFDGTPLPMVAGFLIAALVALVLVGVTERGRLFRPA
jgi:MFS transporter, DHA1 family, multidrug resistance protein